MKCWTINSSQLPRFLEYRRAVQELDDAHKKVKYHLGRAHGAIKRAGEAQRNLRRLHEHAAWQALG